MIATRIDTTGHIRHNGYKNDVLYYTSIPNIGLDIQNNVIQNKKKYNKVVKVKKSQNTVMLV